jgi:hypothetical protein
MTLWKWIISTTFLFVICAFLSVPAIGQGKPTQDVNVVNTPSVNVTNTPTVSLQSGATISATVTNPLDSQNNPTPLAVLEGTQPYEDACTIFFNTSFAQCSFKQVPPGKRLVITEFDASAPLETGLKPIQLYLLTNGSSYHAFPTTFMGNNGWDWFATHQETRMYVQPGNTPVCYVHLTGSSHESVVCSFSGFLQ